MTLCFSFVASSLCLCGRQGFAPVGRRVSVLACGCVLAFLCWPCFGRAGRVSSLCGWPCFGRVSRVSGSGLAVLSLGRGRASLGQNLSCAGRKEPHISVMFTKFKNYDKSLPGHELKRFGYDQLADTRDKVT